MIKTQISCLIALLLALSCTQAIARESDASSEQAPVIPEDVYNRGTPQRAAQGFLSAIADGDYQTAAEYMDLRNLQGEADKMSGPELAREFYVIIKRADWVDIDELVDNPGGRRDDNLPDYRDSIGVIEEKGKQVRLLMQRVPRGDGVYVWKLSNATVSRIPALYELYGYPQFVEALRQKLPNVTILGQDLFKWVIVAVAGVATYGIVFLIAVAIRRNLGDPNTPSHRKLFRFVAIPFGIWVLIVSLNGVVAWLGRGEPIEAFHKVSPIPILITIWMLFGGVNLLREIYADRLSRLDRPGAAVFLHPVGNALKLLIFVVAALLYMNKLGINITTMLAGLGVGGIAVALALQKPLEDVFGAFALYTQKPVKVGDYFRLGDQTGKVEEIGLRTTRIRTRDNTVVSIPNAKFANESIDNLSAREKTRYRTNLRLRFDTTADQMRQILAGVNDLLQTHPGVLEESIRVYFREIADDALIIFVSAYIDTVDWVEYLGVSEELNFKLLESIADAGTSLALPSRTMHLEQSTSTD